MELNVKNLTKEYGKGCGLREFTVCFKPGIYGLLGPNGSGKSTLMHLLTDNIRRTAGEILYDGREIREMKGEYRRLVGYMPQQQGFFPELSAVSFLRYMAELKGVPHRDSKAEALRQLERLDLLEARNKSIGSCSVGMRQRILLGQALLGEPSILLLDEPTAGVDPRERVRIRELIAEPGPERIVLLATHIVSDVEKIADQIILMRAGRIVKMGRPSDLEAELAAGEGREAGKVSLEDVYMYYTEDGQ